MKSLAELMNLSGRVALVTGAAGQLGPMVCETLAELGADLILLDVREEACKRVANQVANRFGVKTWPLTVNLEHTSEIITACESVRQRYSKLDILVNGAAMAGSRGPEWAGPLPEQSPEIFRRACDVNLLAPFVLIQNCAELLKKSGCGSVINFLSIYSVIAPDLSIYKGTNLGSPAAYSASKGALLQLTRWCSTVMAPSIRVNAISPGGIYSDETERFVQNYSERTPLGRMGAEEDLKGAVAFLASDLSRYVTGQNLMVDGGWTTW